MSASIDNAGYKPGDSFITRCSKSLHESLKIIATPDGSVQYSACTILADGMRMGIVNICRERIAGLIIEDPLKWDQHVFEMAKDITSREPNDGLPELISFKEEKPEYELWKFNIGFNVALPAPTTETLINLYESILQYISDKYETLDKQGVDYKRLMTQTKMTCENASQKLVFCFEWHVPIKTSEK